MLVAGIVFFGATIEGLGLAPSPSDAAPAKSRWNCHCRRSASTALLVML
jgi:hypothetical protein